MLNFKGYQIQIELKDGKRITGTVKHVTSKSLTLSDAVFQDGGSSPVFKIKSDKLYDLKVLKLPQSNNGNGSRPASKLEKDNGRENSRDREKEAERDDIWDTEMSSDFDFQGNLQRFNKKDVFKDFQNVEIVKDETKIPHNEMVTAHVDKTSDNDTEKITESINITHLLRNDSIAAS